MPKCTRREPTSKFRSLPSTLDLQTQARQGRKANSYGCASSRAPVRQHVGQAFATHAGALYTHQPGLTLKQNEQRDLQGTTQHRKWSHLNLWLIHWGCPIVGKHLYQCAGFIQKRPQREAGGLKTSREVSLVLAPPYHMPK